MLLIDNNLSPKLATRLQAIFPNTAHVMDFQLEASEDRAVWAFALQNDFHILTKDTDFINLLNYYGFPPKVIRINCGNATTKYIELLLLRDENIIHSFLQSDSLGLLIIQ